MDVQRLKNVECETCRRQISVYNYELHLIRCQRAVNKQIERCQYCQKAYLAQDWDQHILECPEYLSVLPSIQGRLANQMEERKVSQQGPYQRSSMVEQEMKSTSEMIEAKVNQNQNQQQEELPSGSELIPFNDMKGTENYFQLIQNRPQNRVLLEPIQPSPIRQAQSIQLDYSHSESDWSESSDTFNDRYSVDLSEEEVQDQPLQQTGVQPLDIPQIGFYPQNIQQIGIPQDICSICGYSIDANQMQDHMFAHSLQQDNPNTQLPRNDLIQLPFDFNSDGNNPVIQNINDQRRLQQEQMPIQNLQQMQNQNVHQIQAMPILPNPPIPQIYNPLNQQLPTLQNQNSDFPEELIASLAADAGISVEEMRFFLKQQNQQSYDTPLSVDGSLTESQIDRLTVVRYNDHMLEKECIMCFEEFQQDESVKLLPSCLHPFHIECIKMWLLKEAKCPICFTVV